MHPQDARTLAEGLMKTHLGEDHKWKFRFDTAKRRLGQCSYMGRVISLSRPLTVVNDEAQMRDTILHEIAHALAGPGTGHGPKWKAACVQIGARPTRCAKQSEIVMPAAPYSLVCPNCGHDSPRYKRPKHQYMCGACHTKTRKVHKLRLVANNVERSPLERAPSIPAREDPKPAPRPAATLPAGPLTQGTLFGT